MLEQTNDDIDNNTNNTSDDQIKNIDNSQELQNKRSNFNVLKDNIITLKADMIAMKNFMMQKIINILPKEKKKCSINELYR